MRKLKWQAILLVIATLMVGCGKNQSDRSRMDRAIHQMNNHQYDDAVANLEYVYTENPADSSVALLLAQAHLGKANFEMMDFVGRIAGSQVAVVPEQYWVDQPQCDNGRIEKLAGFDARCLIFRLMNNLPDAEDPSFVRARHLLRTAFKDPSQTPSDANFIAALVEFSSAFYRLRELGKAQAKELLEQEPKNDQIADAQFKLVSHNLKRFLIETQWGFKRLRFSYGKLASFVKSLDGKPMVTIGDRTLMFSDNLETSDLLRFASLIVKDKAQSVDEQVDDLAESGIRVVGVKYMRYLSRFDRSFFNREQLNSLNIYWKFNHALTQILAGLASTDGKDLKFKPALLLWEKPPIIFHEFREAMEKGWSQETIVPIWKYFIATRDRWNELGHILDDWGYWFDSDLTDGQRIGIKAYIRNVTKRDPRFYNLPERIQTENVEKYGKDLTEAIIQALRKLLSGQVKDIEPLNDEQLQYGSQLLLRTASWINDNLWHIDYVEK